MWKLRLLCIFITERLNAFHLIPTIKIKKSVMKMNRFILGAIGALWITACRQEVKKMNTQKEVQMAPPPLNDMAAKPAAAAAPASMGKKAYGEVEGANLARKTRGVRSARVS
jgi:hypothetical protein